MEAGEITTDKIEELDPRIERSRAAVLNAATSLLLQGGLGAVTIDGLVAESGVAKTTIYRHWSNRAEILWDTFDGLIPAPVELELDGPTAKNLSAFVLMAARDVIGAPWASAIPALLDVAEREPDTVEFRTRIAERHLRPLRQILVRGIELGELISDLDVDEAASLLLGPMIYRRFMTREPVDATFCKRLVDGFLRQNRR